MSRYRPPPDIDGEVFDKNEAYVRRWPFFSYEGKRWTYRRYGLGQPVSVSIDEVVDATDRLQRILKPIRWATAVVGALGLYAIFKFVDSDLLNFLLPVIFSATLGSLYSGVRLAVARILFARFDVRPRFGKRITISERLDEAFRIKFWGEILAPGAEGAAIGLLFVIGLFGWLIFERGIFFIVGGLALGLALAIFFTRWENKRNAEFERLEVERDESDVLLTEALEKRD